MMAEKTLVIPLTLDATAALAMLRKFEEAGKAAGDKTSEGMDKTKESAKGAGQGIGEVAGQMAGLIGLQTGVGLIGDAFGAVKEQAQKSADYIRDTVKQFGELREMVRGVAALRGETPTNQFTQEQVALSAKGGGILSPTEMAGAQEAWLQYGSGYVSKPGAPGTGLIEQATVDEMLPEMMSYAKSRKIAPDVAGKLIAAIVQTMPKGSKAEEYRSQFMKVMEIAETSKGSATVTVGQIAPLLAEGVGKGMALGEGPEAILQAARIAAVESERGPEESFTYSRALIHEMHAIHKKEGAEDQLGITEDMTVEQKVKAIGDAFNRSGQKKFEDFIAPFAGDKIRGTGAMQTAISKGLDAGMFAEMQRAAGGVSGADLAKRMSVYLASEGGESEKTEADIARATAERGAKWDPVERLKREAQLALIKETDATGRNAFEAAGITDVARWAGSKLGAGTREEQLVNERAVEMARRRAGPQGDVLAFQDQTRGTWGSQPRQGTGFGDDTNSQILRLLTIANQQRADAGKAPLAAPPPQPTARH
jgi:hypothetical protein